MTKEITARLYEYLRNKGFELNFPDYKNNNDAIFEILNLENERLYLAIPLLLGSCDCNDIAKALDIKKKKIFFKIINISHAIETAKKIKLLNESYNDFLSEEIISDKDIEYYFENIKKSIEKESKEISRDTDTKTKKLISIDTDKAISFLFSSGKISILEKIKRYEPLSHTELNYYYKSIAPYLKAIASRNFEEYCISILNTRKIAKK